MGYTYDALDRRIGEASYAPAAGDAGFESYSPAGGFGKPPAGSSAWTFTSSGVGNGVGVSANGTAFTAGNPAAPEGGQVAYLMGTGSITQNVSGWTAGAYTLSFLAAQRGNHAGDAQALQVKVDGVVVATVTPSGTGYRTYSATFTVSAAAHSVTIAGTVADHTAFLDDVALVPASPASRRWTVYDADRPILDFDGSGVQTARYLQAGPDVVDEVLARETASGVAWYLGDRLGTIRDLADNTGAIVDHVDYNAFGKPTGETAPAVGDRMMGFAGMERSRVTGLNLALNRVQDPGTGAWLSEDPIGFAARDPNLRRYVGNSPTNAIDPSGLESRTTWGHGGVLGGGLGGIHGGILISVMPAGFDFGIGGLIDETATVWANTGAADMSTPGRLYVTGGTTTATLVGVRGISDACSRHDAVDAHEQSPFERMVDLGTGGASLGLTTWAVFPGVAKLMPNRPSGRLSIRPIPGDAPNSVSPGSVPVHGPSANPVRVRSGRAPELPGGWVTESGFLNSAERYLGPGYREVSPGRYVSADGLRQVRFGAHETRGPRLHCHFESYDRPYGQGGRLTENTVVDITPD